jgi:hypothetical protein
MGDKMWIKKSNEIKQSGISTLNFLWKDDTQNIYIMDNHLAALWCWLQFLQIEDFYTLVHIDWHWDCAEMNDIDIDKISSLNSSNLQDFLNLKSYHPMLLEKYPIICWDNYIDPLFKLRPNISNARFTVHQQRCDSRIFNYDFFLEFEMECFFSDLNYNLENEKGKLLINVDLDYFFLSINEDKYQAFSDEFIKVIARQITNKVSENTILTIAWSPECCGGWQQSMRISNILCEILEIDFPCSELSLPSEV